MRNPWNSPKVGDILEYKSKGNPCKLTVDKIENQVVYYHIDNAKEDRTTTSNIELYLWQFWITADIDGKWILAKE